MNEDNDDAENLNKEKVRDKAAIIIAIHFMHIIAMYILDPPEPVLFQSASFTRPWHHFQYKIHPF